MTEPRPCSASEAVSRALQIVNRGGSYQLGTGDYCPSVVGGKLIDTPWTFRGDVAGSDCAGFAICWCYKLRRHRPGYNTGSWASVSDDINVNSALEDAQHTQDLFTVVTGSPAPGDLLCYPTFTLLAPDGTHKTFIGHVAIVVGVAAVTAWNPQQPRWDQLDVVQCHGPDGFTPGVVATDGSIWLHHDAVWPKPEHRSWLIRALA